MNILIASLPISAEPKEWNRIATTGEWPGYPGGPRKLDAEDLASIVAVHDANRAAGTRTVMDYEHDILRLEAGQLRGKDVDASGWIAELKIRDGGSGVKELWQRQDWTPAAAGKIAAGEKLYVSPVILFGVVDPNTGQPKRAVLHSVALCLRPMFKQLGPVATLAATEIAALVAGGSIAGADEEKATTREPFPGDEFTDKEWDGDAARFALQQYIRACAFVAEKPVEELTKADCGLPHHEPDGTVNLNGLRAARAAVAGARTGEAMQAPGARDHLDAHWAAAEKKKLVGAAGAFAVSWLASLREPFRGDRKGWHKCELKRVPDRLIGSAAAGQRTLTEGAEMVLVRDGQGAAEWSIAGFRFDPAAWTPERAAAWLREHQVEAPLIIAGQEVPQMELKKLCVALGLPETATEPEAEVKLAEVVAKAKAVPLVGADVAALLGVEPKADLEAVKAAVEKLKTHADRPSTAQAIVAIATSLGMPNPPDASLAAILKRIGELGGRVEGGEAEAIVGAAVAAKKIPPAAKPWWVEAAKRDLEGTKAIIGAMPAMIGSGAKPPEDEGIDVTEGELAAGRQLGLKREDIIAEKKRKLGKGK